MSAPGRFLLYTVAGVEVPVLSTKRLHTMYKFQGDDMVLTARSGHRLVFAFSLLTPSVNMLPESLAINLPTCRPC